MKKEIFIWGRDYAASATYEDGKVLIHKGSQLNYPDANGFKINNIALAIRENQEYVKDGVVVKDCVFDSPSTAAQFITGGSRNGYDTWKVEKKISLGDFLEKKGIRVRRRNKNRKAD